jgi:hypothetical protein
MRPPDNNVGGFLFYIFGGFKYFMYICMTMKNKPYKPTINESLIISQISDVFSFDALDALRSVLHSAAIKKGYSQPALVLEVMSKTEGIIKKGLEVYIPFSKVKVPDGYSQKDGYTVDVYVETKDIIYLVDPKGAGHNNNTPIPDEVKKWVLAKEQVQLSNINKEIRFILLKPNDVDDYDFNRLKNSYNVYGIELHKTDEFLSDFINGETSVSEVLRKNKEVLMRKSLKELVKI